MGGERNGVLLREQPDIVLVMSDQHNGLYAGCCGEGKAATPFLDHLAKDSAVFTRAYCNAPLCVPSRCSFLTGKLPHELGIFDNDAALPEDIPTLAHAMAEAGYETVLAGRMHFKGSDQNHGFERRLTGDITTQYWGVKRTDLGDFAGTLQASGCQNAAGYGPSPVQEYDAAVVTDAKAELARKRQRPLFMVVGLYSPHFPYVASKEDFEKSLIPGEDVSDTGWETSSCWENLKQSIDVSRTRLIRTAYRAMIRRVDEQTREIYDAFARCGTREKIFIYTSDHGDQLGKRGIFGKKTLYEDSIRIPLIVKDGRNTGVYPEPVSLLDLTHTLLDYGKAKLAGSRGVNLFETDRPPVEIEAMLDGGCGFTKAVIGKEKKLLHLPQGDRLCIYGKDEREEIDFCEDYPDVVRSLQTWLPGTDEEKCYLHKYQKRQPEIERLKNWVRMNSPEETARYPLTKECVKRPAAYLGMEIVKSARDEGDVKYEGDSHQELRGDEP